MKLNLSVVDITLIIQYLEIMKAKYRPDTFTYDEIEKLINKLKSISL